jgi:hypothetical protein
MSSNSLFLRMDLVIGFSGEFTFESWGCVVENQEVNRSVERLEIQ